MTGRRVGAGAAAALALCALLAGCGSVPPVAGRASHPPLEPPRPPGAHLESVVPPARLYPPSCDPRASLRPPAVLPRPRAMPAGSTMERIAARGRLIVGVDQNTYLFGYQDPKTGSVVGFDVDIAREVARAIFGDPDRIQLKPFRASELISIGGDLDLVAQSVTITCERLQQAAFSTVYFDAGQRLLVNRGSTVRRISDLGGSRVCAVEDSRSIRTLVERGVPTPASALTWTDCLVLLQQGQVGAVSADDNILAGLAAQDPSTEIVGPRFADAPHGLASWRSTGDLVRFVNGVLEQIRANGTWAAIYTRWLGGPAPAPPAARYLD